MAQDVKLQPTVPASHVGTELCPRCSTCIHFLVKDLEKQQQVALVFEPLHPRGSFTEFWAPPFCLTQSSIFPTITIKKKCTLKNSRKTVGYERKLEAYISIIFVIVTIAITICFKFSIRVKSNLQSMSALLQYSAEYITMFSATAILHPIYYKALLM